MKTVFVIIGILLSFGMFYACSSDDDSFTTLYNNWVLVSYVNETGEVLKEAKGYYYLITFHPDGTYSGKAYGNEMGGKYKLNGKKIQINPGDITKMDVEGSDPDRFFLEHLADVYTYALTDTELWLYYSKDQYFKFRIKND